MSSPRADLAKRQNRHTLYSRFLRYRWGVLTPLICTLVDWPLRHILGPASILMTYLLGVFIVASRYGRGASITASFLSAPLFAFYFASPIFSFAITDLENIVGLAVMIVVANITSNLLDKAKLEADLAERREQRANALYRLSQALSNAQDSQAVVQIAEQHVQQEFAARTALLLCDDQQQLIQANLQQTPSTLEEIDGALAQKALDQHQTVQDGNQLYCPVEGSNALFGALIVELSASPDAEMTALLDTFRNLIAATLERLSLADQARCATLQAESEALRNALLSAISHDLRTPLTRISGAVSALIDSGEATTFNERIEFYKEMLDETQRMSELTGKILDMARLSSGEIILHPEWNALEEIVGSALMRLDKSLDNRPVRTHLPDSLPLLWIDGVLIEQVLLNLIENAVKYTPAGSPIDISAESIEYGIRLAVTDYGFGVPKDMEQLVFEKFVRGSSEMQQAGVGLGLALCRAIIAAHGGRIYLTSVIGKGASFVVELPVLAAPALDQDEVLLT